MSKIIYGPVITDSRGSIGGSTFTSTRFGSTTRARTTPARKDTARKSLITSRVAALSQRWSSLLDSTQRSEWTALAAANPVTDVFGNPHELTGLQFFIRLNQRLAQAGITALDDAPADQTISPLTTFSAVATHPSTLTLTFTTSPLGSGLSLYVFATPNRSPGVSNFANSMAFLLASAANPSSTYAAGSAYTARFGNLKQGRAIAIKAAVLSRTTAALSPYLETSVIIA
jgi:hypothetical protein